MRKSHEAPLFPAWTCSEPAQSPPPRVAWVQERPWTLVGGWEPLSFRRRAGYAWEDEETYVREQEFSDRELDEIRDMGVRCVHIPYAKGWGLRATADELAQQKDIVERAHRRGLKVGLYVRVDAVMPEILAAEQPEVHDWLVRGMHGRPSLYSAQQGFRKRICLLHPGAVRWAESVFQHAIVEMNADTLHLDGFFVSYTPWETCRCGRCLEAYRAWLRVKFADPKLRRRVFGLIDFDRVEMPEFEPNAPLPVVAKSPEIRAWHEHQWEKHLAFLRHVRGYVHTMTNRVALFGNIGWYRNMNYYRYLNVCPEQLFPWLDMVALEDDFELHYEKGKIVSRLGLFKTAREYGIPVASYHHFGDRKRIESSMSLYLAANGGNISLEGFTLRYYAHFRLAADMKRRLNRWVEEHWDLFRESKPHGEIALLRHHPSLAWNAKEPWFAALALEQMLTRMKVPWRMLDRIDPGALQGIRTLLLADMECLSNEELDVLKAWAENGGRLLFTWRTGLFNGFRQRRPRHPILDWSPAWRAKFNDRIDPEVWFAWSNEDYQELTVSDVGLSIQRARPQIVPLGKGALAFLPQIKVPLEGSAITRRLLAEDIRLPERANEIEKFIRRLHGPFDIEVTGSDSVLVECTRHRKKPVRLVHLVQVNPKVDSVNVKIRTRSAGKGPVQILSPSRRGLKAIRSRGGISIRGLPCYAVLVLGEAETG